VFDLTLARDLGWASPSELKHYLTAKEYSDWKRYYTQYVDGWQNNSGPRVLSEAELKERCKSIIASNERRERGRKRR